jgi:hypothetical protein
MPKPQLISDAVRGFIATGLISFSCVGLAHATGPVTILQIVHCTDNNGTEIFQLSDGTNVLAYDGVSYGGSDDYSKSLQALMLTTWATGKTIESYQVGTFGSNCGLWAGILTSVTVQ